MNTIIWLVAGLEGEAVSDVSYTWSLLNESGGNAINASVTFNDNDVNNYVNPGDTFSVYAGPDSDGGDGYFTLILTDSSTGSTIFKSVITKY